jgi:hypothetical protein
MEESNKKSEKKTTRKTGTLGTVSKVEIGKANNRRTILGLEKEAGRMGADASKVVVQKDGKKVEAESKGERPKKAIGQLGVKSADMKFSEPKRFEWKTDAGGGRRDDDQSDYRRSGRSDGSRRDDRGKNEGRSGSHGSGSHGSGSHGSGSHGRGDGRRDANIKTAPGQKKTKLTGNPPKRR